MYFANSQLLHFKLAEDVYQYGLVVYHPRLLRAHFEQGKSIVLLRDLKTQTQFLDDFSSCRRWIDVDGALPSTVAVNDCIHVSTTLHVAKGEKLTQSKHTIHDGAIYSILLLYMYMAIRGPTILRVQHSDTHLFANWPWLTSFLLYYMHAIYQCCSNSQCLQDKR